MKTCAELLMRVMCEMVETKEVEIARSIYTRCSRRFPTPLTDLTIDSSSLDTFSDIANLGIQRFVDMPNPENPTYGPNTMMHSV
jgi:hypothetical protein